MPARFLKSAIHACVFVLFLAGLPAALFGSDDPATPEKVTSGLPDPAEVFAQQGDVTLTQQELDGSFSAIPEAQRLAFIRDGGKVDQLVKALLKRKAVAADAERADFENDPLVAARVRLAAQKELAEAWLEHVVSTAPEADFEALAREDYLVNRERYQGEEFVDVSHILIGTSTRSDEEAKQLATSLHGWLEKDPTRFDELVAKYSDDPETSETEGRYPEVGRGQTVQAFERAAFALQEPGAMSQPVKTQHGYHIIRLNGRSGGAIPPFEEVREQAIERARYEYLEGYRQRYLQSLLQEPIVIPDGAVEIMAKRYFGEDLEGAPGPVQ
jgi:peptidyl-prolyl cis-trans isomerase C